MKLWRISQTENNNYDTYDSAIVAAETEEQAKDINPASRHDWNESSVDWARVLSDRYTDWALTREAVTVEYIGEAKEGTEAGVILASFNAG